MNRKEIIKFVNENFKLPKFNVDHIPLLYNVIFGGSTPHIHIRGYRYQLSPLDQHHKLASTMDQSRIWLGHYGLFYGSYHADNVDQSSLYSAVEEPPFPGMKPLVETFYFHHERIEVMASMRLSEEVYKKLTEVS